MSLLGATTASAASGSNAGAVTRGAAVKVTGSQACGTQYVQPGDTGYMSSTKVVDLSGFSDFTPISKVKKVKFTPTMEKRSVPGSWATWGSPPFTETATPNILYTAGATSMTITLPKKGKKIIGAEVEPNPFEVHTFTGEYKNKGGKTVCTITVDADGNAGARLLAAAMGSGKAKSLTITFPKATGKRGTAGAEVEPNPFEVHNFTAVYKNRAGKTICSIDVDADGNAGARVLAAKVKRAKTMTISSDVDFSFAAIRSR
jgi:hypothetical protein